ncbi:RDD family protein [Paenibacillus solisilvae]|uniref:RDD family protein n=1 Tax=Paenibacillus solisilvae TaxID=2486751 RepID=A0ABW0W1L6_9BACL
MEKASFMRRFAAQAFDGFVANMMAGIAGMIVGYVYGAGGTENAVTINIIAGIIGLFIGWIYYIEVPVNTNGQTLGKRVFSIRIVKENGTPINRWTMFGREFIGKFISTILLGIGYLIALGNSRQALHDRMVNTIVTKEN